MGLDSRLAAALAAALVALAAAAGVARAGTGFFVGFSDDSTRWYGAPAATAARTLGASALRFTLAWSPGESALSAADASGLRAAVAAAPGMRPVLAVYGATAADAPQDAGARDEYCSYVRSALEQVPQANDVEIWLEPNKQSFWSPQFDASGASLAPARYEALLARCWDVLHAFRPSVNVIGPATAPNGNDDPHAVSNVSESPARFLRLLGNAYRTSGRTLPILDTVGTHVYGASSAERPWQQHPGGTLLGEGDWDKLMASLHAAFDGTGQPVPGQCANGRCVTIWYLEDGFQTTVDPAHAGAYHGVETDPRPVAAYADGAAPDQASQIADAVRLAACQPYVSAFFNFQLVDEPDLRGWQSGLFSADLTPKPSYSLVAAAFAQATSGQVDCSRVPGAPAGGAVVQQQPQPQARAAQAAGGAPANDDFAQALELSGASGSVSADTTAATREPGEPTIVGNAGGHSVWFRWTAPASGEVSFDTVGSAFDTTLAVWTGASLDSLQGVAHDDDLGGNRTSRVEFDATAGTTYEIQVDGFAGTTGPAWFGALELSWR